MEFNKSLNYLLGKKVVLVETGWVLSHFMDFDPPTHTIFHPLPSSFYSMFVVFQRSYRYYFWWHSQISRPPRSKPTDLTFPVSVSSCMDLLRCSSLWFVRDVHKIYFFFLLHELHQLVGGRDVTTGVAKEPNDFYKIYRFPLLRPVLVIKSVKFVYE